MIATAATTTAGAGAGAGAGASTSGGGGMEQTQTQTRQQHQQTHTLSASVRKTIQSIKEIVDNFSDGDIYLVLKESNMDPNETVQKLLNQDPFHEVKRKRDRKKESIDYRDSADSRNQSENFGQGMKARIFSDRNSRRGGYARNASPGQARVNREFRVVRDNRVNRNTNRELKPALPRGPTFTKEQGNGIVPEKSSSKVILSNLKPSSTRNSSQVSNGPTDAHTRYNRDANASSGDRKVASEEKWSATSRVQTVKPNNSQHHQAAGNSVVGVCSSSKDPVHVPSPDSRSSASVGAIKREVGVVGGRGHSSENSVKNPSTSSHSFSGSVLGRDGSLSEPFHSFSAISKTNQVSQTGATEAVASIPASRSFLNNQYNSRPHQQVGGHSKASQPNKEWKPKSSQKSSVNSPEVIGAPAKSISPPAETSKDLDSNAADLPDKFSRVSIHENQNVVIAQHIRVPETDRCRLTFGSFGVEFDASSNLTPGFQEVGVAEESNGESTISLPVSAPESSSDDAFGSKQIELLDDQVRNSASDSPASGVGSECQLPEKSSSPPSLDSYADIGLVRNNSPSYAPPESQQRQDDSELPSFSAYDTHAAYDISYFRTPTDETGRGHGLPSLHEALNMHTANSIPTSTLSMAQQQQQPPMAQMYPPVHVPHFSMPYRQFLPQVYVPPLPMPGYSSSPAYPHPSNGNSFVLMHGGGSHPGANGLKYGVQQFKPVPGNSPAGFGNFTTPSGYAISAPGVVGSATGLEDSSRMKYKDGNLYVPNPQTETSEMWIQNPRDLPGLQSAPYYNMSGQTPHAAYLPSHTGHASFNAAAAQSSHMQFPGLYPPPPPQPTAMASPHHLGPVMGGNVGVGVAPSAPGAQVGAYQQPQLGHLNWTTNF